MKQKARTIFKKITNFKHTPVIILVLATLLFFAPLLPRLTTYIDGGDSMFNAWTLARNHHCLKGGCESYIDGNIYYPNQDTMLYSETQLSTGVLTLPLHFINDNPVFSYNVWKIVATFLSALFMYLLVRKVSRGHELISVVAGLIFAFAPFKISALGHLQNLSIFYLPLIVYCLVWFLETPKKRWLIGYFISLVLLFYASWYQMVFVFVAIATILAGLFITKLAPRKKILLLLGTLLVAVLTTIPLAVEYLRFSRENNATFTIGAQTAYASSVVDYFIPDPGTGIGKLFNELAPEEVRRIPYNLDSQSYHGVTLYVLFFVLAVFAFRNRKKAKHKNDSRWFLVWTLVGVVGFVFSLGPLLKVGGSYIYATLDSGVGLSVPLPYLLLDFLVPPITFIRAVGRWSTLVLFMLCVLLAYLPKTIGERSYAPRRKIAVYSLLIGMLAFELLPLHQLYMTTREKAYNMTIPQVYQIIKKDAQINNLVVLHPDPDYSGDGLAFSRMEPVLWAGYHNKNVFNGYSGYTPENYDATIADLNDLQADDVEKMKQQKIDHVLINKQLMRSDPEYLNHAEKILPEKLFEDESYALFKL